MMSVSQSNLILKNLKILQKYPKEFEYQNNRLREDNRLQRSLRQFHLMATLWRQFLIFSFISRPLFVSESLIICVFLACILSLFALQLSDNGLENNIFC